MGTERVFLPDDAATAALGARLAQGLAPGDVVLLEGGLGAGKTALARAMIRTLAGDAALDVPSPSFSLVQPYVAAGGPAGSGPAGGGPAAGGPILHADLYRLRSPRELDELGLFDDPRAIVIIEWPERVPEVAVGATMSVALSVPADHNGRLAEITR